MVRYLLNGRGQRRYPETQVTTWVDGELLHYLEGANNSICVESYDRRGMSLLLHYVQGISKTRTNRSLEIKNALLMVDTSLVYHF
jgi:hypothetical protein